MFNSLKLKFMLWIKNKKSHNKRMTSLYNQENENKKKNKKFIDSIKNQFFDTMTKELITSNEYSTVIEIEKEFSGFKNMKQIDLLEVTIDVILTKHKLNKLINFYVYSHKNKETLNNSYLVKFTVKG